MYIATTYVMVWYDVAWYDMPFSLGDVLNINLIVCIIVVDDTKIKNFKLSSFGLLRLPLLGQQLYTTI